MIGDPLGAFVVARDKDVPGDLFRIALDVELHSGTSCLGR